MRNLLGSVDCRKTEGPVTREWNPTLGDIYICSGTDIRPHLSTVWLKDHEGNFHVTVMSSWLTVCGRDLVPKDYLHCVNDTIGQPVCQECWAAWVAAKLRG